MKKRKIGFLAISILFMCLVFTMTLQAAYPSVSASRPMYGYGWKLEPYEVYSNSQLTGEATLLSYRSCQVTAISGKAAQITYKAGGKRTTGWIALNTLIYNPKYQAQITFANSTLQLYKRPTVKAKYVRVSTYAGGIAVSEKGSWIQVLFQTGGKYRLGWMKKAYFNAQVRLSMETTTQPLANGTYTISPRSSTSKALTYDSQTNGFRLMENKKSQTQKFRFQYVNGSYYVITPLSASGNLAEGSVLTTASGNDHIWLLSRTGGYFYIREKSSKSSITYSSENIKTGGFKKVKAQQWRITKTDEKPSKETSVVFSQYDPKWGGATYMNGPSRRTISTSGCGVMALTNAVYALNGEFISPTKIANFSVSRGHYFYNQGTADTLYKDFAKKYGAVYHFKHKGKTYSLSSVRKHIKKGGVAIALVPGHYIAIVGYGSADNQFLVLDSAIYGKRPTTINGDWLPASTLGRGTLRCEYFHLLSRR